MIALENLALPENVARPCASENSATPDSKPPPHTHNQFLKSNP